MKTFRARLLPAVAIVLAGVWPVSAQQEQSTAAAADEHVLVGAGDIAKCEILGGAIATGRLLDRIPGTVFTVGDHAYDDGTEEQFAKCYTPAWGRHKARTRPSPGNHDYHTGNGKPYYDYFGENAGPPGLGYYSYDLGEWHIIALNSVIAIDAKSPQGRWLAEDLKANARDCIIAYWHAPLFSSGPHGGDRKLLDVWEMLYEAGVDIVLNGHDHTYERFAPQDPGGKADPERGIRQFVVGTGGGGVYKFKKLVANSELRTNSTYGVLKLTLGPGRYAWEFVSLASQPFTDTGTGTCSPKP
ncbi:MAG: Alkaline phosphatase [Acidobacteria bacterium]|nr:Alkaline phosphatase [Acidobacteriota bacterium]